MGAVDSVGVECSGRGALSHREAWAVSVCRPTSRAITGFCAHVQGREGAGALARPRWAHETRTGTDLGHEFPPSRHFSPRAHFLQLQVGLSCVRFFLLPREETKESGCLQKETSICVSVSVNSTKHPVFGSRCF